MQTLLIADDESSIRTILEGVVEGKNVQVICCADGSQALQNLREKPVDAAVVDIRMPGLSGLDLLAHQGEFFKKTQIIVMTAQDTMENAVNAMKNGAFDYIIKPFDVAEISIIIDKALENAQILDELKRLKSAEVISPAQTGLVGRSRSLQEIFKIIGRVANQDVTVLIQGESGTGKEMIARAIHSMGSRHTQPFVAVNCAAIPEHLLESELFGHRRGAFTGAVEDKTGYFERAHQGTLFLDEIGELPLSLQAKILRFLQEKTIQRVGDYTPKTLDVRVIAATNRRLDEMSRLGQFREDLYFRLSVVPITVPALRERPEDIRPLLEYFLARYIPVLAHEQRRLSAEALELLLNYSWPGNVRELENIIKRVLVLGRGAEISREEIQQVISASGAELGAVTIAPPSGSRRADLEETILASLREQMQHLDESQKKDLYHHFLPLIERPLLRLMLDEMHGNQLQAAEKLGINRNTLRKKIRELGLGGKFGKFS